MIVASDGNKLHKGVAEQKPGRVIVAEQDTPAAEKTIEAVLDVMGSHIDRAAPLILVPAFAVKLPASTAYIEVGPKFDHGHGGAGADYLSQRADIAAPGLSFVENSHQRSTEENRQKQKGRSHGPVLHVGYGFGPDDACKKEKGEIDEIPAQGVRRIEIEAEAETLQQPADT